MSKLTESIKSWKTTILGVAMMLVSLLIMVGVLDPGHEQEIRDGVKVIADHAEVGVNAILSLVTAVAGLIGVLSKDGDK